MKRLYSEFRLMVVMLLFVCSASVFTGCGADRQYAEGEKEYQIYYINKSETRISPVSFYTAETNEEQLLSLLFEQMKTNPEDTGLKAVITEDMELGHYTLVDENLSIDFGDGYRKQIPTTEVLTRAAIVRTLCQLDQVEYVTFTVQNDALLDLSGTPVGVMNDALFVENTGNEINAYESAQLALYFADEDGTGLCKVSREEMYNSNISMERLVVDKIIAGPTAEEENVYPSVNPNTKVLSVTIKDGVCYVNLDSAFQVQVDNVAADVTVYSLVNSLMELNNVNKVQLSIDGETKVVYRESISLENPLERNYEIVKE